jgi:flagellar basal body rod protein FlgG
MRKANMKKIFRLILLVALPFFLSTYSNAENYGEVNKPVLDPGLRHARDGMRAFQTHYTNFVIYSMNLYTPGNVEIGVYNQNINNQVETVPFYRWRMGPVEDTGGELDFFIESQQKGFFVIRLPFGLGYTRDGRIRKDHNGRLITVGGGFPLVGESGDIYLPEGFVSVASSGAIFVDGDLIDRFTVAVFRDRERLVTLNGSVFYVNGGEPDLLVGEEHYKIRQGFLEQSNVLKALTGDISLASKSYEGSAKAAKMVIKLMGSAVQLAAP